MSNFPVVNINGDSIETLVAQHWKVLQASRELKTALAHAVPHGRNYQTLPDGRTGMARREWLELLAAAELIHNWAEATLNDLLRQNEEHSRPLKHAGLMEIMR